MYFPSDMTFQYFFLDTYIGYFLQALPIAIITAVVTEIAPFNDASPDALYGKAIAWAMKTGLRPVTAEAAEIMSPGKV